MMTLTLSERSLRLSRQHPRAMEFRTRTIGAIADHPDLLTGVTARALVGPDNHSHTPACWATGCPCR